MKKFLKISLLAALALLLSSCESDRSAILKVYNWSDYLDLDLIEEFEQWYEQQTGEKVKIVYQTFDINETMLAKIEKGHEDFDVVCPSDYIIERMLRKDMLLPLNRDFGTTPNYIDSNIAPFITRCFNTIDGNGRNANDYAVGFMWGTTGILYNVKTVDEADTHTWGILVNKKYDGQLFLKDAPRDVFAPSLIYLKQDEINAGKTTLNELMYDSSDESIAIVEEFLKESKELIAGWEADFGKEQMAQEKGSVNLTWSGDAVWAIREAAELGVELSYTVPDEGSTYWFDGWVIPKYAKNVKAAQYFINFLCMPENAIRNMDVTGYVSCIGSPEVLEAIKDDEYEPVDLTYFFGPEADSVRTDSVLYPDRSVIERCTMEHDWGNATAKLLEMWSRVKGDNASGITYIIIAAVAAAVVIFIVAENLRKKHRRTRKPSGKKSSKK